MAQTASKTTRRRTPTADRVERAQVSAPVPGRITANIGVLGLTKDGSSLYLDRGRKSRYATYYEMYRQHPTVRAAIEKIAKVAVSNGYRFTPAEAEDELDKSQTTALRAFFRASNGSQLLRVTYKDLLIYGEAFWLITRPKVGKPQQARRLHPMYMDEKLTNGQLTGWRFGPVGPSDKAEEYDSIDVVQFKFDDPDNDIRGLSLLSALELTVASDLFAMKFNERYFENSAHTGVIFNMKNTSPDEVERNRTFLEQRYVGTENAHKPVILEGDVSIEKSVVSAQEMQFIEGRRFNRQEILSTLDIDPTKLGISEDSNRSTSKEADNTFRQENIAPLQLVVEEEVNNHLILQLFGWDDVLFRQNDSSRRDLLEMMKMFGEAERMGVYSINQIKGELGLPPITGGDVAFVQTAAGAIPVEWLDDVAKRLIGPSGQPMSGQGTENQAPTADSMAPANPAGANGKPQGDTDSEGSGGENQSDG
jgi:HK97 family phage portal protein